MRPSALQTPLPDGRIRCDTCLWRCELPAGATGQCGLRTHRDGTIVAEADGLVSGATIGPIEDHRLWHFFPDAQVFGVGSVGTPLVPASMPRIEIPYALPMPGTRTLEPERVVQFAQQRLCRGVLWTYGDPAIAFEWVLDGVKLGRAASRFTALASTGYFSPAAFAQIAPYLDGMRLDVYGFSDRSYRELAGFVEWRTIFKQAAEARQRWNIHLELVLRVTAGVNDSETEVGTLARWIKGALGSLTPLHILADDTDTDTERALLAARAAGLHYVYGAQGGQATRCPRCDWVVVERGSGPTQLLGVHNDTCENCAAPLGLRTSLFRRNVRYELAAS